MTGVASLLPLAHALADAGGVIARRYFRTDDLGIESKTADAAGYDPVTLADRGIEAEMRRILAEARPDDGILGEEFANRESRSGLTWVIDPIDGTRAFMCGLPSWGTLIAVNDGSAPVLGIMDQPITRERFSAIHLGGLSRAELHDASGRRRLSTRKTEGLDRAVLCCTSPEMFDSAELTAFDALRGQVRLTRLGTDCYGYAMLAAGQIDLVVESSLKPYDIQALIPLVHAAGGVVTDWRGGDAQQGGRVIAAATPALHSAALTVLSRV